MLKVTGYEKRDTMPKKYKKTHGIDLAEVYNRLKSKKYISSTELKKLLATMNPDLDIPQFRSVLYSLEKENYIYTSGSGMFTVLDPDKRATAFKSKFAPKLSISLQSLVERIDIAFPYLESVYWESSVLHDFMVNQPKINLLLLDIEKGSEHSVFDLLRQETSLDVFLSPDSATIERYVSDKNEPVILSSLVSQAPKANKGKTHHYAKIEKILVDILVDKIKFFPYQGEELVNIYENVFERILINEDTLIRYAQRRSAENKLKDFILGQTDICLRKFNGGNNDLRKNQD